jgi:hypothetical protein
MKNVSQSSSANPSTGKTFAEVREARLNDNANPAGSVHEGSNAVEDIGADVSA